MLEFSSELTLDLLAVSGSDLDIVNAARVSLNNWHAQMERGDDKLIGFLMRERHGSPFEHNFFHFRVHVPIFVVREHHRHRIGHSYNEVSGRYSELKPKFYIPKVWRRQVGKPGAYTFEDIPTEEDGFFMFSDAAKQACLTSWEVYQELLKKGAAKELASRYLPLSVYTTYLWSCNVRSLMHFLGLRNAPQALYEIRMIAQAAEEHLQRCFPITHEAFIAGGRVSP